jgi:hypothetical protein
VGTATDPPGAFVDRIGTFVASGGAFVAGEGAIARTIGRWETGQTDLYLPALLQAAALVHPVDAALAEEIAVACGSSLDQLGIVKPAPPAPAPETPAPPAPAPPAHLLADSVVCAAADAIKALPEVVRLAVYASFRRARELRMTMEQVEQALATALGLDKAAPTRRTAKKGVLPA